MTLESLPTKPKPSATPASRNDDSSPLGRGTEKSDHLRYLPFVDGLRAVSILSVVAFHVGMPGVPGGFVGVDIFFVISGFLIINQIKAGLSNGRFSIFSFYAHRGLRILPPYLIALLVTYALAPFFLPTTAITWDFLPSAALSPLMISNVVFYLSQGYFDISGIEKPLLHTWTLAVEEQFYFAAPILLMLAFKLNGRRFGAIAFLFGMMLAAVSLIGAIAETATGGRNPAFYLSHWRAWEFVAGGLIGAQLIAAFGRLPRAVVEIVGLIGAACIVLAVTTYDAGIPYPSWNAILPVIGAALVILCGATQPDAAVARLLSLRFMVAIGLVSYSWYLWHWPLLSFLRINRLDEHSLVLDGFVGGLLPLALAWMTYRFVERPIRLWRRRPGNVKQPARLVAWLVTACVATGLVGGASALGGYWSTETFLASHYDIDGNGVLDNGCESKRGFEERCFEGRVGVLIGDSHATVLAGSFAKRFDTLGIELVSLARGSCYPLLLTPSLRGPDRRDDCARLIAPYDRLLARPTPIAFAVISGFWGYGDQEPKRLSDLISEFGPGTRILLIGPVPTFLKSSLECVVLSDRYFGNRDRCVRPRSEVLASTVAAVGMLKSMPDKYQNVRYLDPTDDFCDHTTCRPFQNNHVYYTDTHHLSPAGADRLYDDHRADFLWLAGKE